MPTSNEDSCLNHVFLFIYRQYKYFVHNMLINDPDPIVFNIITKVYEM